MVESLKPEVSRPTGPCPEPGLWHCYDDMASEHEVFDFLASLVYLLKPRVIIETGCYKGHATEALAWGCAKNGRGCVSTADLSREAVDWTKERLIESRLHERVLIYQMSGVQMIEQLGEPIDFAFLDSGMDTSRMDELKVLVPKLSPGAVVAIHDTGVQFGMREFHLGPTLRGLGLQYIYFDTPRGLTLCRKQPEVYP